MWGKAYSIQQPKKKEADGLAAQSLLTAVLRMGLMYNNDGPGPHTGKRCPLPGHDIPRQTRPKTHMRRSVGLPLALTQTFLMGGHGQRWGFQNITKILKQLSRSTSRGIWACVGGRDIDPYVCVFNPM